MKQICAILFILSVAFNVRAQSSAPVQLAIVSESPEAGTVADVLTAEFTKNANVHLLERAEIERVYREQGLSAANRDDLKLGRLLGADGLVFLGTVVEGTNQFLNVRLVAVKSGVVLVAERFPWPMKDVTGWSPLFARRLDPLLPKLAVPARDAIPISVVNLRSAVQSDEGKETEAQLKLLTIQRLSREPRLFVLERQRMEMMSEEKTLKSDESTFWDGSYLLEGTVDQSGYSATTVTINGRLTPPKGGVPTQVEVSGSRTNLAEVVNQLVTKVGEALKVDSSVPAWNAADEAGQYFKEAQWAMHWELYQEAQAAAESAWALGIRNSKIAALRIRAYSQSMPLQTPVSSKRPEDVFDREIVGFVIPDANQFRPLTRALELYCEDADYLLSGTNNPSVEAITMGLQLLRRTAGLLESYCYSVELRAGHEEQLASLRAKMRQILMTLDEHPFSSTNQLSPWNDPRENYKWLKWEAGGICFDQPEDVLPMARQMMKAGYHPTGLPRLVGWSWESTKRIPGLQRRLVADICSDTNPAVRMEGLYLAVALAPHDAEGSLERNEHELLSALWENRQWLYRSAENISLVERTRQTLFDKYEYPYGYPNPNEYFDHEPFASFKHRLRMDFLANESDSNPAVFQALFPVMKMETPDQARELLPLATSYQQKFHLSPILDASIKHLRLVAGLAMAEPRESPKPTSTIPAENVLEAKFIKWNLRRPGIDLDRTADFHDMIVRNGKLWLRVRYLANNGVPLELQRDFQTTYLVADPQKGVEDEIQFPDKLGTTDAAFEITADSIFASAQGRLYRFKFQERTWDEIQVPLEGSSQLVWLKGSLYVSRNDGLLRVNPDSKAVSVLVSSRRQPALNEIDPLWTAQTRIYARADGKLGAISEEHCWSFEPETERWNIRTLPLTGTNNYFQIWTFYTSAVGSQQLLAGGIAHRYLVGYWNDDRPPESLLMEITRFKLVEHASEQLLKPVRWEWPQGYSLEPASICGEGQTFWVLCPCKLWQNSFEVEEPLKFLDNRQATLFCLEPESRQPLSVPIHFEENEQVLPYKWDPHRVGPLGRPIDMFSPQIGGFLSNLGKLAKHVGNAVFWVKTPEGLVFGGPNYQGCWLIPNSTLESRLKAQRQIQNQPAQIPVPR